MMNKVSSGDEANGITPENLKQQIADGEEFLIIDIRPSSDFEEWSIDPGNGEILNISRSELEGEVSSELEKKAEDASPVIVTCAKGESSKPVARSLDQELETEAKILEDGMEGWATIYEKESFELENGELVQYRRPSSGCLAYLVKSEEEAAVIDPLRSFTDTYIEDSEELKYAIDTHIHADHISGVRDLGERDETTPVIPEASRDRDVQYIDEVETVEDGETLQVGDVEIKAVHTPGHTTGMTSYLIDGKALATGDGLFVESVARPDLEKGDDGAPDQAAMLYETLQEKILSMDDDVYIAPGHFSDSAEKHEGLYMRKVGELKEEMEPLSYSKEEFVDFILEDMPPRPSNYQDVISTNLGKQSVSDKEAFEMELGPNNCAATEESMA